MKSITKNFFSYMVIMLLIGMVSQKAHALPSKASVIVEGERVDCLLTSDGTSVGCGVPMRENRTITGVASHINGTLDPLGTLPPSSYQYSTPDLTGILIWTNAPGFRSVAGITVSRLGGDRRRRPIANSRTNPGIHRPSSPQYDHNAQKICFVENGGPKPGINCLNYADGSNLVQKFDLLSHRGLNHNATPGVIDQFDAITDYTLDLDSARHCWTDSGAVTVMCKNFNDLNVQVLASSATGLPGAIGITSKNGMLYVTDGKGAVHQIAASGLRTTLTTGQDLTFGIDTDGQQIYFTIEDTGELKKMNMDGSNLQLVRSFQYQRKRWNRPDKTKTITQSIGWIALASNPLTGAQLAAQQAAEEAARQLATLNAQKAAALAKQARADLLAAQQAAELARQQAAVQAGGAVAIPSASLGIRVNKKGYTRVTCFGRVTPGVPTTYKVYLFPAGGTRGTSPFCQGSTSRVVTVSVKGGGGIPSGATSMLVQIVTPAKVYPPRRVGVRRK